MILKFLGELLGSWGRRSKGRGWGSPPGLASPALKVLAEGRAGGTVPPLSILSAPFVGNPGSPGKPLDL